MEYLVPLLALSASVSASNPADHSHIFQRANVSDALSSLSSIESLMAAPPPTSIIPHLKGVPTSLYDVGDSPSALASLAAIFASTPPEWFKSLDSVGLSYIVSKGEQINSLLPIMESLEAGAGIRAVAAGAGTATGTVGTAVTTSETTTLSKGKSTITSTSSVVATASETASSTSGAGVSSATKSGIAPEQTGVLVAALLGAAGVLGVAVAL